MGRARFVAGRVAAAFAVLTLGAVAAPAGAAACAAHDVRADGWTRIAAPRFARGPQAMTGYDVARHWSWQLVATNGTAVAVSHSTGCGWTASDLPAGTPLGEARTGEGVQVLADRVTQVRFGSGPFSGVWAIGHTEVVVGGLPVVRPRVLVSNDGGRTFGSVTEGLPAAGRPVAVRGLSGRAAVLLFQRSAPTPEYVFFSTADGVTWAELWRTPAPIADFVVDDVSPGARANPVVFAWNHTGVRMGRPGGDLRTLPEINGNVRTVDLALAPDRPARVEVYFALAGERAVSRDGGANFRTEPAPESVQSVSTFQPLPSIRALSTPEHNVLVESPARAVDLSPAGVNVRDVRFASDAGRDGAPLYAFEPAALYRRLVPLSLATVPEPPEPPVDVTVRPGRVTLPKPSIVPRDEVIRLRPGQRRVVDYRVSLPPVPTPLDVFFITDSTGSMSETIASVQYGVQSIVDGLAATGISAEFGVGDFRDYSTRPSDQNYPYKRRRVIGPPDTDLAEALESITTGGGTADGHDAGLEAIYQAATGAGRLDPAVARGHLIPPGLDAKFRPEAMKVVLVAADDNFRHPETNPGYPGPSVETVSDALRARDVRLVGLHVETGSGSARADMERLARDSGAVAPAGGIDCDGDDEADVAAFEPLVCDFGASGGGSLADAFVAMLAAIEDVAAVDLAVAGTSAYVRPLGDLHHPEVNVKAPNAFTLPVEFRCTTANAGTRTRVRVSASSRGTEQVATGATFACGVPSRAVVPEVPVPPAVPPVVVAALAPPPPPPPPGPIANANPNVNPNVNPNPNPQVNGNTGFAAQEDEQHQLAYAQERGVPGSEELAMTGLGRAGPPLPALAWAAAFGMTGAAAFGLRRARRTAAAPAYARSRPPR